MGAATTLATSGVITAGPLGTTADALVEVEAEVVGVEEVSAGALQAAASTASVNSATDVRPRMTVLLLFGFGFVPYLGIGAELRWLLDIAAPRRSGVDVILGSKHKEEHHPADGGNENPADQPIDEHRGDGRCQRH